MKLSLYINPQTPGQQGDHQIIADVIEQVLRAEELGLAAAFLTEHHFTGYNAYSDPLIFASYLAGRTSAIRLGFSVAVPALHQPIRFAEQTALLDVLCQGRAIVGVGVGGGPIEYLGYGVPLDERRERIEEVLDVVVAAWQHRSGEFHYDTPHYKGSFDGRIIPASWRKPHPLIARAVVSEQSLISTARRGWPVFLGRFGPEKIRAQMALYGETLKQAGHDTAAVAECLQWTSLLKIVHVAETHQAALDAIRRPLVTYLVQSSLANSADYIDEQQAMEESRAFMERAMIVGTPDEVVDALQPYRTAGVGNLMLWLMFGQIEQRHALHSLDLIAREVMPALQGSTASSVSS